MVAQTHGPPWLEQVQSEGVQSMQLLSLTQTAAGKNTTVGRLQLVGPAVKPSWQVSGPKLKRRMVVLQLAVLLCFQGALHSTPASDRCTVLQHRCHDANKNIIVPSTNNATGSICMLTEVGCTRIHIQGVPHQWLCQHEEQQQQTGWLELPWLSSPGWALPAPV